VEPHVTDAPSADIELRCSIDELAYPCLIEPDSFNKYGVAVSRDLIDRHAVDTTGLRFKELGGHQGTWTRASTSYRPRITLLPAILSDGITALEDAWLREYQLARSLRRPIRIADMTLHLTRFGLSERFTRGEGFTHALALQHITVRRVGA
jgi:hypothetical protein